MDYTFIAQVLFMLVLGVVVGSTKWARKTPMPWLSPLQKILVYLLIASLGLQIGSDPRVIESLGDIGLSALLIVVAALAGSLLCATVLRRRLGLSAKGRTKSEEEKP